MIRPMYLYMKVTRDKYELPVAIADSAAELARILGVKVQTVRECTAPSRVRNGTCGCYRKVLVEDE